MSADEFKQQYLPYQNKLYRIAYSLLENASDAEDIVQEIYIKLWNKRDQMSHINNYESFCVTITKNLCFDFIRSKSKLKNQDTDINEIADSEQYITDVIDNRIEKQHIDHLMKQLPEQQKKVLLLKHYNELSSEEIEEITGLSNANIRVLLSRARKKMRELLLNER